MALMILILQKIKIALGIALCVVGIAGTLLPIFPGVPFILAGVALIGADHPLVLRAKAKFNRWKAGLFGSAKE